MEIGQNVLRRIKEDLSKGLSSELKTQSIIEAHDWNVDFGYEFLEAGSSKPEAISMKADRIMRLGRNRKLFATIRFTLFILVKKSRNPWVVTVKSPPPQKVNCSWDNLIFARNLPDKPARFVHPLNQGSLLARNKWEGMTIHEAMKKNHWDLPYQDYFSAICRAAYSHISSLQGDAPKNTVTNDLFKFPCVVHFAQPLLILDGALVRAYFNSERRAGLQMEVLPTHYAAFYHYENKEPYAGHKYRVDLSTLDRLSHYLSLFEARQRGLCSRIEYMADQNCGIPVGSGWTSREQNRTAEEVLLDYLQTVGVDPDTYMTKDDFLKGAYDIIDDKDFLKFKMIRKYPLIGAETQKDGYIPAYYQREELYHFDPCGMALETWPQEEDKLVIDSCELYARDLVLTLFMEFHYQEDGCFRLETDDHKYTVANFEEAKKCLANELGEAPFLDFLEDNMSDFNLSNPEEICRKIAEHVKLAAFNELEQAWFDVLAQNSLEPW